MILFGVADLHVGGPHDETRHARELVRRLIEQLDPQLHLIALLGDNTQDGTAEQLAEVASLVSRLERAGFLVLTTIGNHDVAAGGWQGVDSKRREAAILSTILRAPWDVMTMTPPWHVTLGPWRIISLDSLAGLVGPQLTPDLARGKFGEEQLAALRRLLEEHDGPAGLIFHHHPTYSTHLVTGDNALVDMDALAEVLAARPVEFILCGHEHPARGEVLELRHVGHALVGPKATIPREGKYGLPWVELGAQGAAGSGFCWV